MNDINMTSSLIEATSAVGIVFIDHIIIGKNRYYSFQDKKATFLKYD
jgi:DNA repair protein RadC